MAEPSRESVSPERGDNLTTIRSKIDKCKHKISQIRLRILTEQQIRKQYVDEYLNATSQSEFTESKPHFAHVKAQFEKKNAKSQATVNQLQAKLKRAVEKLASLERVQRELTRIQEQNASQDANASQNSTAVSSASGNSSTINSLPPTQSSASMAPTWMVSQLEDPNAQLAQSSGSSTKKQVSGSVPLRQTHTSEPWARSSGGTAVLPQTSSKPQPGSTSLKHPASSASLRLAAAEAQAERTESRGTTRNVLNTVANLIHFSTHAHALSKHHSNSTNALSNRKADEHGAAASSPSCKSPVVDRDRTDGPSRSIASDLVRRNSHSAYGEHSHSKLLNLAAKFSLRSSGSPRHHTFREQLRTDNMATDNSSSQISKRPGSADNIPGLQNVPEWHAPQGDPVQQESPSLPDTSATSQSPKTSTLPNSFRYGDARFDGERASVSSVTEEERAPGSNTNSLTQRHARWFDGDYVAMLTQLQALQDHLARLEENHERFQEEMRSQTEVLLDRTSRLANTCTLLEEHLNDQIDLHQSSTRTLNNEINVVFDKLMFENRERKHEIEQISENLSNRLGLLEAEQRRKQQTDPLSQGENTSSVLVAKLIKLAIALVSVVMLIISMCTAILHSTFRTPLRIVITLSVLTLILAWWLQDELANDSRALGGRAVRDRVEIQDWLNQIAAWFSQLAARLRSRGSTLVENSHGDT